ncbi:unnamed protein product [Didymodactylos carnosus]|uniref:PiggyBac transposable element-derived protein domain-containing protein n=1 Tax=Didymodactylos carnosus TaxID=1234261 RepID=A0A815EGD6_9BILA|nr:unnamed protein product [Didymodactylos carnosus]CAF4145907.1 unnamed protein product [Didymodactylos carnosus]
MVSSIEGENDSDFLDEHHSGSETQDGESETSDNDDEIDLENHQLNDNCTWQSSYNFRSGMTWSSNPHHFSKTNFSNDNTTEAGLIQVTENISPIEDSFLCFMSEKMLEKLLVYSNCEYSQNDTAAEKSEKITIIELKAFIGLLLLSGLLGKSKIELKCLWRRSPLESPIFKAIMPRSRFQKIIACLRFVDKKTREERKKNDKFAALREIWSYFQDNLQKCYIPGYNLTIDEQLLDFHGK